MRSVDRIFQARRARGRYFPEELFAEPAWDMLLDLLRRELTGRRLSASDLCLAAGVPGTMALRWISDGSAGSRDQGAGPRRRPPDLHHSCTRYERAALF